MALVQLYPDVGFHFQVFFDGIDTSQSINPANSNTVSIDSKWSEVSGLSVEITTEELIEGGENRFVHKLPQRAKFPNLVLKRGYFSSLNSPVIKWAVNAIQNFDIKPCLVNVMLLNDQHKVAKQWSFNNAYPVKMNISDFKAIDNGFLIESLELTYQFFTQGAAGNNQAASSAGIQNAV